MQQILAVDPGIRGCGIACFADGRLYAAAYVASDLSSGPLDIAACVAMARAVVRFCAPGAPGGFSQVVCEWPQVYTPGKQKGDPNDLPPMVGVDCAICAFWPNAQHVTYLPAHWKGQIPKGERNENSIIRQRCESRLTEQEGFSIWLPGAKDLAHNVWDAIGIGLHHLGRFERFRAIAR